MSFIYSAIKTGLAIVLVSFSANVSFAETRDADFQAAYEAYLSVSNNEGGSAKKLAKRWDTLHRENPNDPLTLVVLGSSHTLMGRDALMPWSKLRHTEKGLEEMALAQRLITAEHDREFFRGMSVTHHVKTTAAIVYSQVPDFFGRHEDGFYLFEDVLSDPAFQQLPGEAKTYVYYFGIAAAAQLNNAVVVEQWKTELAALQIDDSYTSAALALE